MNIAGFSIQRPVTVLMGVLGAFVLGAIGFSQLGLDFFPDIDVPMVSVITQYHGTPPEEMEEFVTKRIEEAVATVENYKGIRSVSQEGLSVVTIDFEWGQDMEWAAFNIREKVDSVADALPDAAGRPLILRINPHVLIPVVTIDATGIDDMRKLRKLAEDEIKPELEKIPGVAAADIYGGLQREILVEIDWQRLAAYNLDVRTVEQALQRENLNIPAGFVTEGPREFAIRTIGEFDTVDQIKEVVVSTEAGRPVHLRDIATVRDTHKEVRSYARYNGRPSVSLSVRKESGGNTVKVSDAVHEALARLPEKLPPGVELKVTSDQADFIRDSLHNLYSVAIQGAALAVIIIFLFLSTVRGTLVVAVSIPLSVLATFAFMYFSGMTLNIITMGGLVLAIGRIVDDSVVVLENIFRHLERGEPVIDAAVSGTRELAMAIAAATFTDMCVFLPLLVIGGMVGAIFSPMSLVVMFGLFSSLVVAVTVVPMLASRLLTQTVIGRAQQPGPRGPVARVLDIWKAGFDGLERLYRRAASWALRRRAIVMILAAEIFIASLLMMRLAGFSFFPALDSGQIALGMEAPLGSSLDRTNQLAAELETVINDIPELKHMGVTVGQSAGAIGRIFGGTSGTRTANFAVSLVDLKQRQRTIWDVEDYLRQKVAQIPDVVVRFRETMGPPGAGGDLVVTIVGDDLDILSKLGQEARTRLIAVPGISETDLDWEPGSPEYQIVIDRQKAGRLGLTPAGIAHTIQAQVYGTRELTKFRERGDEYDITIRAAEADRDWIQDIKQISIPGPEDVLIPLANIASINLTQGPTQIVRDDRRRSISINATISDRDLKAVVDDVDPIMEQMQLPADYSYEFGGTEEERRESYAGMGVAFLLGLMLIYIILASQFESLIHPFVIMLAIPLELVGVFGALLLTGTYFSIMVFLGVLMLTGMVVSNAILVVQLIVLLRKRGIGGREGIVEAGAMRLRPIVMTTTTTIIAMTPVALSLGAGSEFWQALAIAVIGGLATSTLLTLFVVPVAYSITDDVVAFVYRLFGKQPDAT